MIGLSTTAWWVIGYAIGGSVVVIAATLLIVIILLARRIVRQADDITLALDGAMANTEPLFDLAMVNHAIQSLTRGLKQLAGREADRDERGVLQKLTSVLSRR